MHKTRILLDTMDPAFGYWFLQICLGLLWAFEFVTDAFFGWTFTASTKEERHRAQGHYIYSAQIVKILWNAEYSLTMIIYKDLSNYLFMHERYVHPNYVLKHENVNLFYFTQTHAIFAITDYSRSSVYDTKSFPFFHIAQRKLAQKLIIMPIASFHQLSKETGDPKVSIGMFAMTARCGSTLISQIMNRVPHTRSMSEPWPFWSVRLMHHRKEINLDEARLLLKGLVRVLAKIEASARVDRVVIKLPTQANPYIGVKSCMNCFPKLFFSF